MGERVADDLRQGTGREALHFAELVRMAQEAA